MTFWKSLQNLVDDSKIKVDRPKGSVHPRYSDYIYPFDYGYLDGTTSTDGGGIDCWIGSLGGDKVTGIVTIVDSAKKDSEIKVLLGCTAEDMQTILECHKRGTMNGILSVKE
ncbi:MAG TPA: inorganic pyrophosphatase [Ignavibacteria bacterium]|nr:inorganic pyrophosphatase [Ignavibacteria bacterium]